MVSPIKIILIVPLLLLILFFVLKMQNRIVYRFSLILIALLGIVFVINPDFTTALAHALNVGRGNRFAFLFMCYSGVYIYTNVVF